jgi:hypothetical protein
MGGKDHLLWVHHFYNELQTMGESPTWRYVVRVGSMEDSFQQANDDLRVSFDNEFVAVVLRGHLQAIDESPEFCCIVRGVPEGASSYSDDMSKVITKDGSVSCISWVALRSAVKVEFKEISGGGETSGTG